MSPPKYKDISKSANDILNKDFCFDRKFKLKSKTANGVEFTTEGLMQPKSVSGSLSAKFSPFAGINVKKCSVTTAGRFITEATLDNAFDGMSFTVKAQDGADAPPSGEVAMDYKGDNLAVNASVDVTDGPTVYSAATFAYEGFVFGGEARYNTQVDAKSSPASLVDYNACIAYNASDFVASLVTKKKASIVNLAVHHEVSQDLNLGATVSITPKSSAKVLTVGGVYTLDSETKFQGKVNSEGIVSGNAIQQIKPKVQLITSVQVDAKAFAADSHKFGLQLILG